jgi:hypothetical protein
LKFKKQIRAKKIMAETEEKKLKTVSRDKLENYKKQKQIKLK